MKVAYYSPLPPERVRHRRLLGAAAAGARASASRSTSRGAADAAPRGADVALYHVGNDPDAHGWIVDALRRRPGVVVLHEFVLHHLVAGMTIGRGDGRALPRRDGARRAASPGGCSRYGVLDEPRAAALGDAARASSRSPARCSTARPALIVHSRYVEERAREAGYDGPALARSRIRRGRAPDVAPARRRRASR